MVMTHEMQMLFLFVCGGAILWGAVNVLKTYLLKNCGVHEDLMVVGTMLGAAISSFAVELAWNGIPRVRQEFWIPFAITAVLNIGIQYWNVKALKIEEASIVVPLASAMPIFVIFMSWLMLGEWPTAWGRVGIGLIAAGSYVLNLKGSSVALPGWLAAHSPERWHGHLLFYGAPWIRLFSSKGAKLALFTSYLGAIAVNFDKPATLSSSPMVFTGSAFLVVACFVWGWSSKIGRWHTLDKQYFGRVIFIGILLGIVGILVNAGYFYGIVPYVGTLKRTQIFWTVLFAGLLLKEKHTGLRLAGAAIMFAGTVLIAF